MVETESDAQVLNTFLKGGAVETACALIHHARQEHGRAALARLVTEASLGKGKTHMDQRHAAPLHKPCVDAGWARDFLHVHRKAEVGLQHQKQGGQQIPDHGWAPSSRSRTPVTPWAGERNCRAASRTSSGVTASHGFRL